MKLLDAAIPEGDFAGERDRGESIPESAEPLLLADQSARADYRP